MIRFPSSGSAADDTASTPRPVGPPGDAARPAPPRCPRCGARMGHLAADDAADALVYCGCCGVVRSALER
ncbi:MAG: hypothetical protein MUD17_02620 [Gemmatimonadaceae bacterium]|jgi:hypothetical protein|nr:hypothetical protein [Gemmatimonadaceae bacterium]